MEAPHIVRDWPNFSWIQLDILDMVTVKESNASYFLSYTLQLEIGTLTGKCMSL